MYLGKQQQEFNLDDYEVLSLVKSFQKEEIPIQIFEVKHKTTSQLFTLKKIYKPFDYKTAKTFIKQFQLLKSLNHPNIIKLFYYKQTDNQLYALYEFVEMNLRKQYKRIKDNESMMIIIQIAEALEYLHSKAILHRDVNISNIIIAGSDMDIKAKLTGFEQFGSLGGQRYTQSGSLDSLAPQIINQQIQNQKVDVWGLGIIMYVLFAKQQPFYVKSQMSYQITTDNIKKCNPYYSETIPEPIKNILQKVLVLNPLLRLTLTEILSKQCFRQYKVKLQENRQKQELEKKLIQLDKTLHNKKSSKHKSPQIIILQNQLRELEQQYKQAQQSHQSQKSKLKKTQIQCMNLQKQRKKMQEYRMNLEKSKLQLKKINNNIELVVEQNKKIKKKTVDLEAELEFLKNNQNSSQKESEMFINEAYKKSVSNLNKEISGNIKEIRSRNNTRELMPPSSSMTKTSKSNNKQK